MNGTPVGRWMSVDEVLREVEKDEVFYRRGNGGMTISGGEPLMQGEFALALLREAKKRHIFTAIETSGQGDSGLLLEMASLLRTIYMDVKSIDSRKHKLWTGVDNIFILRNITSVANLENRGRLILRTPVIPGFNDTEEDIDGICRFIKTLPADVKYELLPYHRLGRDKYTGLGRSYAMGDGKLEPGKIEQLREVVKKYGLEL